MNKRNEAKLNMYRTVEDICEANSTVFSANVAFMAAFNAFKAKIVAIIEKIQQDSLVITGIAEDKRVSKVKLCGLAADTASVIYAFASTIGNNTLKMEVDFPVSKLSKMRDEVLAPNCQNIHDKGVENLAALQDYGVTQAMLDALQEAIDSYSSETPKPRAAISNRKAVAADLARLFDETDEILKERMDKLVEIFKASHPDFVKIYESARRIVAPHVTHTQLKGTIVDKDDKTPVKNATITAVPTKNGNTPLVTQSDAAGDYHIKPISHGTCSVTVTADGYQDFQTDIDLIMGEIFDLDVELGK